MDRIFRNRFARLMRLAAVPAALAFLAWGAGPMPGHVISFVPSAFAAEGGCSDCGGGGSSHGKKKGGAAGTHQTGTGHKGSGRSASPSGHEAGGTGHPLENKVLRGHQGGGGVGHEAGSQHEGESSPSE